MTARDAVYRLVKEAVPGDTPVLNSNSVDSPDKWPFVVITWQEMIRQFGDRGPQFCQIWVHDQPADYTVISDMLYDIRKELEAHDSVLGDDGWIMTQADWQGDSGDLFDEVHNTVTRNANFLVVSRRGIVT